MDYINEPFLQNVIAEYTDIPESIDIPSIITYFQNKVSLRDHKTPLTIGSKVNQISVFKKKLKKINDIPLLNGLKMPIDIMEQVTKNASEKRIENHRNLLRIPDSDHVITNILSGLSKKTFDELYPALLLASGRRPTELYMMKIRKGKAPGTILFTNQLKKRGKETKYEIPLLVPVDLFRKAIKNFQQLFPEVREHGMSPDAIAKKYSKQNANAMLKLSGVLTKQFAPLKLKASDLRRMYVAKTYKNSKSNESFNVWIMDFLGHDDISVSLNYSTLILEDPIPLVDQIKNESTLEINDSI